MKKTKTKLNLRKSIVVSLEKEALKNVKGGFVAPTDSCPGAQCPSEANSCNLSCNGYPKCAQS